MRSAITIVASQAAMLSGAVIWVLAATAQAAPLLSAQTHGWVMTNTDGWYGYQTGPKFDNWVDVTPLTAQDHVGFDQQTATIVAYPGGGAVVSASGAASAVAGLGDLHLYLAAHAATSDGGYGYLNQGNATATASFADDFTIAPSAAHPLNSWVWLHAKLDVGDLWGFGPNGGVHLGAGLNVSGASRDGFGPLGAGGGLYYNYDHSDSQGSGPPNTRLEALGEFQVGTTYTINGYLEGVVGAQTRNSYYTSPILSSWASVDASNTSHSYLWPDDPSVVLLTSSGASYAMPEPMSLLTLALAGAGLLGRRRPKTRPAPSSG